MKTSGYSPYQQSAKERQKKPRSKKRWKKWLLRFLGALLFLLVVIYIGLGDLRFIPNNYLKLTFFQKHYLIIFQNQNELRPAGGFLTAYAEVSTTMGFPTQINFGNSYDFEAQTEIKAPYPQEELLGGGPWYIGYAFRDANWDADFPDAAQDIVQLYNVKHPEKEVDGVIAMNFSVVEDVVDAVGGIEIEGKEVTGDTLFSLLTQEVNNIDRHDEQALAERKDVFKPLSAAVIKKSIWHPFKVRTALENALEEKEMYAWLASDRLQEKLEKRGWANQLNPDADEDFISVNVANLGAKKADRYLEKELHHFVDLTGPLPVIRSELTLRLLGTGNQHVDPNRGYVGYVRLYVPTGAQLEGENEAVEVMAEEGATVFGQLLEVPLGEERRYVYEYSIPRSLWGGEQYDLNLIKQSGSELMTTVVVEVPGHDHVESDTFEARENRASWRGMLEKDVSLSLNVKPDELAPFPVGQKFKDINTIFVEWVEPLEETTARDATNYTLIDRNHTNSDVTDEIKVVYAEVDGQFVTLEIEGATEQPLERYTLRMNDLRDRSGNTTDPETLEVTVVQRLEEGE